MTRELSSNEIDAVSGAKNQIVNFGGGISWVIQTSETNKVTVWLCTPTQCIDTSWPR